jgi:hypothetical protein
VGMKSYRLTVVAYPPAWIDNCGEPCPHCQLENHTIDTNLYATRENGDGAITNCCWPCVKSVLLDWWPHINLDHPITAETACTEVTL